MRRRNVIVQTVLAAAAARRQVFVLAAIAIAHAPAAQLRGKVKRNRANLYLTPRFWRGFRLFAVSYTLHF